jgi:predicted enzyme related to lactoylglutathione lyase
MTPGYASGKICYVEIPADDIGVSAEFYARAFGWEIGKRGDGSTVFTDTVGQVSGTWVVGRPPMTEPGLLIYVMVADAAVAIAAVRAAGGEIVRPVDPEEREVFATFRDPAGNVLGIYQQPGLAESER